MSKTDSAFTPGPMVAQEATAARPTWHVTAPTGAIGGFVGPRAEADAKEFVHRFNCHDDLYDACRVALGHLTTGTADDWWSISRAEVLRAAIAKADGQP